MKNVKIEKIEMAEVQIDKTGATLAKKKKEYLADDGRIDPEERADLDRISGKIESLKKVVAKLRAEIEANRKIWEGKSGAYDTILDKIRDLEAFGFQDAEVIAREIGGIEAAVSDQRWADATSILDQGEVSIGPVWDKYLLQKDARDVYDPLRFDFDTRAAAADVAEPQTETIVGMLTQIEDNIGAVESHIDGLDYVNGLALLEAVVTELEAAEAEIIRVQEAQANYLDGMSKLSPKLEDCVVTEFASLAEDQKKIAEVQTRMDAAVSVLDFDQALVEQAELILLVDAFLPILTALKDARDAFDRDWPAMQTRLSAISSSELGVDPMLQQRVLDAQGEVEAAVAAEDYEAANILLSTLDAAVRAVEDAVDTRTLYETREAAIHDEVIEASFSDPRWDYLAPIQADMARFRADMEASANAGDFDAALLHLEKVEGKLAEFKGGLEAKHDEYLAARATLDTALKRLEIPKAVPQDKEPVRKASEPVDKAAEEEDWVKALSLIPAVDKAMADYDAAVAEAEKYLLKEIGAKEPAIRKTMDDHKALKSPRLQALIKEMAKFDLAMKGAPRNVDQAYVHILAAETMANDVEKIAMVMTRLDAKFGFMKDDEARTIVDELSEADLETLPMEAQNMLVAELMGNDEVSEEDHTAIQKIWSTPSIDPEFEAFDQKTRDKIAKAFVEDPDVHYYATHWATMDPSEKQHALQQVAKIPAGPDGWNVGELDHVDTDESHFEEHEHTAGHFSETHNEMALNLEAEDHQTFAGALVTVTHEAGHKYQAQLIARLKGEEPPPLKPGAPEYEQAKAFELNEEYRNKHTEKWRDMVEERDGAPFYGNTPEETHSRNAERDIAIHLDGAFGEMVP